MWLEGIASALSGRTRDGQEEVGSLLGLEDSRQVDYGTAGHFVRWLLEEHGVDGIRALQRESPFEQAYELELADAIEDYEANAPWSYPRRSPCRGEPLEATSEGRWAHDIQVDCDDPFGSAEYQSGPMVLRTVDIEEPGMYRLFVTEASRVGAIACQLETLLEPAPGRYGRGYQS